LREQAVLQQQWLQYRLDSVLPRLMRQHGVDMWIVAMREYNEDPVFWSLVSPTTLFARRRRSMSSPTAARSAASNGWRWVALAGRCL